MQLWDATSQAEFYGKHVREGHLQLLTTNSGFLVLLEIVVDEAQDERRLHLCVSFRLYRTGASEAHSRTLPTAASPSRTSLTLLLGLLGAAPESAMVIVSSGVELPEKGTMDVGYRPLVAWIYCWPLRSLLCAVWEKSQIVSRRARRDEYLSCCLGEE